MGVSDQDDILGHNDDKVHVVNHFEVFCQKSNDTNFIKSLIEVYLVLIVEDKFISLVHYALQFQLNRHKVDMINKMVIHIFVDSTLGPNHKLNIVKTITHLNLDPSHLLQKEVYDMLHFSLLYLLCFFVFPFLSTQQQKA